MQPVAADITAHPLVLFCLASLVGLLAWNVRQVYSTRQELGDKIAGVQQDVTRLSAVLIGADGQNGIRSEVVSLRASRHEHGNRLHAHEGKLDVLQRDNEHLHHVDEDHRARIVALREDLTSHMQTPHVGPPGDPIAAGRRSSTRARE